MNTTSPTRHNTPANRSTALAGRVPPHNLSAEESVIGAVLLSADALIAVDEVGLSYADFYKPGHQHIYNAVCTVAQLGGPADTVTVADELQRHGLLDSVGGVEALHTLQNATPAISNAAHYAKIVHDAAVLRRLIMAASEISELAYNRPDNVDDALDRAEQTILSLGDGQTGDTLSVPDDLAADWIEQLEARYAEGGAITGLPTGLADLDRITGGLRRGGLYVLGARPAVGKSGLLLGIAAHVAIEQHRPTVVFSLEMGHDELMTRLISHVSGVDSTTLSSGNLNDRDWANVGRALTTLHGAPLVLDDDAAANMSRIRARARRVKARYGDLALIVVDYLQLVPSLTRNERRDLDVGEVTRQLKLLARTLDVPILVACQVGRAVETRADKRPLLSDMRESGEIEAHADMVAALYRDEVYDPNSADRGVAEVNVLKHRGGPTGQVKLVFLPHTVRFANAATP